MPELLTRVPFGGFGGRILIGTVAGFIPEWWPASYRNTGRLQVGIPGRLKSESAGILIWERKADGGFPDAKALKQRVRDRIDPGRDLGHIDRASTTGEEPTT